MPRSQTVIVPGAVLAARDLALEVEVLERVVLGGGGEVVLPGLLRQALRDRPGGEHAVALEAQVPVQAPGVVLLDHEPRRSPRRAGACPPARLGVAAKSRLRAVALRRPAPSRLTRGPARCRWAARPTLRRLAPRRRGFLRARVLAAAFWGPLCARGLAAAGRLAGSSSLVARADRVEARLQRAHQVGRRRGASSAAGCTAISSPWALRSIRASTSLR